MSGGRFGWWVGSLVLALALLVSPLVGRTVSAQQAPSAGGHEQAQAGSQTQADMPTPVQFRAFAANLSGTGASAAQSVQIRVDNWSSDAERDRLLDALKKGGGSQLLTELQKAPRVGFIRTPDSIGYDLRFARVHPFGDGGYRIFIATDRRISFWEVTNQTRSMQYPFTLIELRLNHDGNGEGKMTLATKVTIEANQLVLENYSAQPVLLTSVTEEKAK